MNTPCTCEDRLTKPECDCGIKGGLSIMQFHERPPQSWGRKPAHVAKPRGECSDGIMTQQRRQRAFAFDRG